MRPKIAIKLTVDVLMTLLLLLVMGYQFWGEAAHEWIGTAMFILFIAHHILNSSWHKNIFKEKYTIIRIVILGIDILVLVAMLVQMYSGIVMSRYVFNFFTFDSELSIARKLHIIGSYWGFIFVSMHLGLHWSMIISIIKKNFSLKKNSKIHSLLLSATGILVMGYGVFSFVKRDFFTYLFLKNEFVFLNYDESKIVFYIDYLALMGFFILIVHYSLKLYKYLSKGREA